jgi:hypothetical protein
MVLDEILDLKARNSALPLIQFSMAFTLHFEGIPYMLCKDSILL